MPQKFPRSDFCFFCFGVEQATGIAQVLCILVELARPPQLLGVLPLLHQALLETSKLSYISASINLRKLRAKLAGRVALVIPVSPQGSSENEDEQVPESIETIVQDLLDCLQDKVRNSIINKQNHS
jgi:hypothetical protein